MKKIMLYIMTILTLTAAPAAVLAGNAYADCGTPSDAKSQVLSGIGATTSDCSGSGVSNAIAAAVKILSVVAGAAGLIMIVLAGFKYITSGGDSGKVANAKSTLIYALVGIAIAVLAQLMVNIVITQSAKAACPPGKHLDASGNCVK